jgi:LPXTG-motif cell wall-anchored protein
VSGQNRALRSSAVSRRATLILLGVALLGLVVPSTGAGEGTTTGSSPFSDQGSNANYRSYITAVTPNVTGLSVQILEFADRLQLVNHTGRTVTVFGYQHDPYARVLADGTVQRNVRSPATYLDESFYGNVKPPAIADPTAPPKWEVLDRTGQLEWHDHRIHWPSPTLPPQVTDKGRRTLIFAWTVPIEVGTVKGAIAGQLYWVPNTSKTPLAAIVLGVAILLAGLVFVVIVRRRRAGTGSGANGGERPEKEAW